MKIINTATKRLPSEERTEIKSGIRRFKNKQISYAKWSLIVGVINLILLGGIVWQLLKI